MKAIIISGSYRDNGATSLLVSSFKKGLLDANKSLCIKEVILKNTNVNYCKGCMMCLKDNSPMVGKCIISDDMHDILIDCIQADIIVLASPIYEGYITSIMKKFHERTLPLSILRKSRPFPRNCINPQKSGIILLASGVPYPLNIIVGIVHNAKKILLNLMKIFGVKKTYCIAAGNVLKNNDQKTYYSRKAYDLGKKICMAAEKG